MGDVSSVDNPANKLERDLGSLQVIIFANEKVAQPYKKVLGKITGLHTDMITDNITALMQQINSPAPGNVPDVIITEYNHETVRPTWLTIVRRIKKLGVDASYKSERDKLVHLLVLVDPLQDIKTLPKELIELVPANISILSKPEFLKNPQTTLLHAFSKLTSKT